MKIKIVGEGTLAHDLLTVGKEYEVISDRSPVGVVEIISDNGHTCSVNKDNRNCCGFLYDSTGDLKWEVVV